MDVTGVNPAESLLVPTWLFTFGLGLIGFLFWTLFYRRLLPKNLKQKTWVPKVAEAMALFSVVWMVLGLTGLGIVNGLIAWLGSLFRGDGSSDVAVAVVLIFLGALLLLAIVMYFRPGTKGNLSWAIVATVTALILAQSVPQIAEFFNWMLTSVIANFEQWVLNFAQKLGKTQVTISTPA